MTLDLKVPPPAVILLCGTAMWIAAGIVPSLDFVWPAQTPLAIVLATTGFCVDLAGLMAFRSRDTTINPLRPHRARTLVCHGIYRYSRNPMYLGQLIFLAAWAIWLGNAIAFAGLPVFVIYLTRFQIQPEERILAEKFGDDYADYVQSVRRWL